MRQVPGTPIIYISKSVVILEPISSSTEAARDQEERAKFRAGLKGRGNTHTAQKRKRDDEDRDGEEQDSQDGSDGSNGEEATSDARPLQKKKRARGPKQPNPLSMKKSKKVVAAQSKRPPPAKPRVDQPVEGSGPENAEAGKRKRRRKHKPKTEGEDAATEQAMTSP